LTAVKEAAAPDFTILLVGAGAVGARAARQLVDTPGLRRLLVAGRGDERVQRVARALGPVAEVVRFTPGDTLPAGVDAVATALPAGPDVAVARAAITAGAPVASAVDDEGGIAALRAIDPDARAQGVTVAVGCGLAPGLADVLAGHAGAALDRVDEVHVARAGVAGPASRASVRRARHERPAEWRRGTWEHERHGGAELVWFPDPIGATECETVAAGTALLVDSMAGIQQATTRFAEPPSRRIGTALGRPGPEDTWGAVRVEVWGSKGRTRAPIVYGVIERTAVAAGTVLAVTTLGLAGALPAVTSKSTSGAHGLAALVDPPAFLAELARRGVKAAVFEGVAVA
jgi:hypothetical protein